MAEKIADQKQESGDSEILSDSKKQPLNGEASKNLSNNPTLEKEKISKDPN